MSYMYGRRLVGAVIAVAGLATPAVAALPDASASLRSLVQGGCSLPEHQAVTDLKHWQQLKQALADNAGIWVNRHNNMIGEPSSSNDLFAVILVSTPHPRVLCWESLSAFLTQHN